MFQKTIFLIILAVTSVFLYKVQSIVILFFAAFVLASAINPLVETLSKKMPRKPALLIVALSAILVVALFFAPLFTILIKQAILFLKKTPEYWSQIEALVNQFMASENFAVIRGLLNKTNILNNISSIMSTFSGVGQNIVINSIGVGKNIFTSVMFLFSLALVTIYMLMDKEILQKRFLNLFPPNIQNRALGIAQAISKKVGGYVISQLFSMFVMGLLVTIGLSIIGVEFSLILGLIAGLLDIIPIVGPFIAVTTIILVSLAQKPILALLAFGIYMLIQWITDTFIKPVVYGKFLNLHPLTLIFSLLCGGLILGVTGVILAPAVVAMICVLIDELYIKKINPDALLPEPKPEPIKIDFKKVFNFKKKK